MTPVVKSTYRKLALFVRVGGEGNAHTCVKRCYRQLRLKLAGVGANRSVWYQVSQ
jgi:hypothetical protein